MFTTTKTVGSVLFAYVSVAASLKPLIDSFVDYSFNAPSLA